MKKFIPIALVIALAAFAIGRLSRGGGHTHAPGTPAQTESAAEVWTCTMHLQIRQPGPGKCPICHMDLVPVKSDHGTDDKLGPHEIALSDSAQKLARLETAPVERRFVSVDVRITGKVEYDETRLSYITARVPGRLDRLYVDFTGVQVQAGDHLVYLYSPELLEAQEELIQALKTSAELKGSQNAGIRQRSESTVASIREKLRLWGLSAEQIKEIEASNTPQDHLTINAPISGVVMHKNAVEGMYVETGTRVYTIADLSHVWVRLDAYESDLAWIHYGQEVDFQTEAYPGETFTGQIAFIDPVLDPATRTVKVRVNVPNLDGRLKPQMFVRATVHSRVAEGGRVMDPTLAGKWISPMHPEIVKDHPGNCDICGMALVKAEDLGYVVANATPEPPLVIPASAPLLTGKRAVVYVSTSPGHYEGRQIEIGARAGDYYLVKSGLKEGEQIVVKGNFKIDSALQILAKPSMMNPTGGGPMPGHHHGESTTGMPDMPPHAHESSDHTSIDPQAVPDSLRQELDQAYTGYRAIHEALSKDDLARARQGAATLLGTLNALQPTGAPESIGTLWAAQLTALREAVAPLNTATNLEPARAAFEALSQNLTVSFETFGHSADTQVREFHCPMAFNNRGASWLQAGETTENPYFGARMYGCGDLVRSLPAAPTEKP